MKRNLFIKILFVVILFAMAFQAGCRKKEIPATHVVGFPKSFADLAQEVSPAVVNISTETTVVVPGYPFYFFFGRHAEVQERDFLKRFFGNVPNMKLRQQALGSGIIIEKDGYIVTNNHVISGAQKIRVILSDGRTFKGRVIGADKKTDLALVKVNAANLPTLRFGDSDSVRPGDWVIAVGNPFGLEHTVTQGIISATGRAIGAGPYENFLQTDAPINPGNSGGPLVNVLGEVIGINTAIIKSGQGIGFAIPSNTAQKIVSELKAHGKVIRGWIGVEVESVTPGLAGQFGLKEAKGALVAGVVSGGPAGNAGIKSGDIIVSFDGKDISQVDDLARIVADTPPGKTASVKIMRNGRETVKQVTVSEEK
ncbi:MAG: trypsin-like peptidase domain-containing protein [Nitrospiraceae bacterium]|nr:trypsin-like peptidase domain-containing protein [Nitrospiraceae bacterium]